MTTLTAQLANMNDSVPCDAVGRRIICDGEKGTVLFVGNVPPTAGLWLGVEWDNPERGKHDGSNEGIQYFKSSHPTSASFIRPKKANFGVHFLTAVKRRYELEDNQDKTEKFTVGKTEVQMVGFQSVSEKQSQLHNLEVVSVKGSDVSCAGQDNEIQQTTPNIVLLNLSENLLSSWDRVADITRQLTKLKALELRGNRLRIPANPSSLTHAFANLKELALNKTGVNWSEVLECAPMWPVLEELYLSDNRITDLQEPVAVLQSLTLLDLSNNPLSDGEQLKKIGHLPRLNKLLLTNTRLRSVHFDDVGPGCKTAMFPSLEFLAVDNNSISQWSFVNELEKLQSLQKLSCLNNPLMSSERNAETAQQLIVAKIGNLQVLNKSNILPDERRGAELDYRKIFGKEWLEAGGHQDPEKNRPSEAFTAQHPRYQILIEKYGAPEDGELKEQQPFALKNQLLTITFKCPDRDEKKHIEKKLPGSMTVQKVKGLLYRLLKVPGSELKLTYTSSKMEGKEIEIDNDLKPLQFYSIEDGDSVLVRWS